MINSTFIDTQKEHTEEQEPLYNNSKNKVTGEQLSLKTRKSHNIFLPLLNIIYNDAANGESEWSLQWSSDYTVLAELFAFASSLFK